MHTLRVNLYSPPEVSPEHEEALLILPNEIAAGLEDYHGARARAVADLLGVHVLAYERPFSASQRTFNLGLRRNIPKTLATQHEASARELDYIIGALNPVDVYAAGHSAGAMEAIGITATGRLPIQHLVTTDPGGLRDIAPIKAELWDYAKFQVWDENRKPVKNLPNDTRFEPELKPSLRAQLSRTAGEIAIYSAVWRSSATATHLRALATEQPDSAVTLVFPEHTHTGSTKFLQRLSDELKALRRSVPYARPFTSEILAGTYHSNFNNYAFFARIIAQSLALHEHE